jgi:hypothetical protein
MFQKIIKKVRSGRTIQKKGLEVARQLMSIPSARGHRLGEIIEKVRHLGLLVLFHGRLMNDQVHHTDFVSSFEHRDGHFPCSALLFLLSILRK